MTTLTGVGINVHTSLVELISANIVYEVGHLGRQGEVLKVIVRKLISLSHVGN